MSETDWNAFLAAQGFGAAALERLPGDAGRRRYARLRGGPVPALLADCSAEPGPDLHRFAAIAAHLGAHGVRVPAILARDDRAGLLLVEDLGPDTHAVLLDRGADPIPLYAAAGAALGALSRVPPPALPELGGLPRWDGAAMAAAAAATFLDWWWPAALGRAPEPAQRAGFHEAVRATVAPFEASPGFVHRDWFPANLVRGADGVVGVLDMQDAALGHPAYDLVSLVEDARRDVPPPAREAAIAAWRAARGAPQPDLEAAMAAHAAIRHLRVAALWVRLDRRDGKPGYLVHGPRCWRLLDHALAHPAAAPLTRFLDDHVPPTLRRNPSPRPVPSETAA